MLPPPLSPQSSSRRPRPAPEVSETAPARNLRPGVRAGRKGQAIMSSTSPALPHSTSSRPSSQPIVPLNVDNTSAGIATAGKAQASGAAKTTSKPTSQKFRMFRRELPRNMGGLQVRFSYLSELYSSYLSLEGCYASSYTSSLGPSRPKGCSF